MRNSAGIKTNWAKLAALHEKFPDWRISQFLVNVLRELDFDPFYLEDDEFIEEVEKIIERWASNCL